MDLEDVDRQARPLRIAIVEDEGLVAFEMELHLSEAGHEVVGAADSLQSAVELVEQTRPDLVLIDVQLADGSRGTEVAHALREWGVTCLFATGNCPGDTRHDAIGCLHKPYTQQQLLEAVDVAAAVMRGRVPTRLPIEMHLYRSDVTA